MKTTNTLFTLQAHLQTYGALRSEAWQQIQLLIQQKQLQTNQSFIRKEGTIAYIADGLLKEYNVQNRSNPSIINFIASSQCLVTRKHNQTHYLKACLPTLVYYWDFEQLQLLYHEFKELKQIYDALAANYDEAISFRQLVLETASTAKRIHLFRQKFAKQSVYLKKKDVANYLQLNYTHFLHINNNLA